MSQNKLVLSAVLASCFAASAQAAVFNATQDAYAYEFMPITTDGDGLLVAQHESNHGFRSRLAFDNSVINGISSGDFSATLYLYSYNAAGAGGFVNAAPGYADVDGPGGIASVNIDVFGTSQAWNEANAQAWPSYVQVSNGGSAFGTASLNTTGTWLAIDVTSLVEYWLANGSADYGLILSQEAYGATRADNGSLVVAAFRDSEFEDAAMRPYLEVTSAVPVPAAVWLFGSGLIGLAGVARRKA